MAGIPNLYYQAISMDELRAHPHFAGLPPVEKVPLFNTSSYKYVRQDSALWDKLHSGVLTTGILNGALGFYEQAASRRLGIPRGMVSHSPLLSAYRRLQQPVYTPPVTLRLASSPVAPANAAAVTGSARDGALAPARDQQPLPWSAPAAAPVGMPAGMPNPPGKRKHRPRKRTPAHAIAHPPAAAAPVADPQAATLATPLDASPARMAVSQAGTALAQGLAALQLGPLWGDAAQQVQQASRLASATMPLPMSNINLSSGQRPASRIARASPELQAYRQRRSMQKAEAGGQAVRMAWGTAQEAATLYSLMHIFPQSALQEIGLCWLDPRDLPPDWGFRDGDLPPLGASPDGLLRHPATAAAPQSNGAAATEAAAASVPQAAGSPGAAAHANSAAMQRVEQLLQQFESLQAHDAAPSAAADAQSSGARPGQVPEGIACESEAQVSGNHAQQALASTAGTVRAAPPMTTSARRRVRKQRAAARAAGTAGVAPRSAALPLAPKPPRPGSESIEAVNAERASVAASQVAAQASSAAQSQGNVPPSAATSSGRPASAADEIETLLAKLEAHAPHAEPPTARTAAMSTAPHAQRSSAIGADSLLAADSSIIRLGPALDPNTLQSADNGISTGASWLSPVDHVAFQAWEQRYRHPRDASGVSLAGPLEIVEVKNTSPFSQHSAVNRKGKTRVQYVVSDRGPRQQVPTYWVPQLQMHMLAAKAESALLVSRSATKGITLYRMARDDGYLRQMLGWVSRFYRTYVRQNRPPPVNMFMERPEYQQFLRCTVDLAYGTPALVHVPEPAVVPGSSSQLFLSSKL